MRAVERVHLAPVEGADAGDASSSYFFKTHIDGLPPSVANQIRVTSGTHPNDFFDDEFESSISDATESKYFTAVYNDNVYLPSTDDLLTETERALIKTNLMLNAVHNDSQIVTLRTGDEIDPFDVFERRTLMESLIRIGMGADVFNAGGSIEVIATSNFDIPGWLWEAKTSDEQVFSSNQGDEPFRFRLEGAQPHAAGTNRQEPNRP